MLNVAIVGCGFIVRKKHIKAFLRLPDKYKIVAICDINEAAANNLAKEFNIPKIYTDFSKMFIEVKPDVVDIATPPSTHAGIGIEAIKNNCHVIFEKPMALNTSDCDSIIDAAEKNDRKVCIIHNQIFNPAVVKARKMMTKGGIGKFLGIRLFLCTPVDYMTSNKDHWAHKLPGGVLGETGPHAVYLSLCFIGPVMSVSVKAEKLLPVHSWSRFENFRIDLAGENGMSHIHLIYATDQQAADMEIIGEKGILKLDLQSRALIKYKRTDLNPIHVAISMIYQAAQIINETIICAVRFLVDRTFDADCAIFSEFADSINNRTDSPISVKSGRDTVRVMEELVSALKIYQNDIRRKEPE